MPPPLKPGSPHPKLSKKTSTIFGLSSACRAGEMIEKSVPTNNLLSKFFSNKDQQRPQSANLAIQGWQPIGAQLAYAHQLNRRDRCERFDQEVSRGGGGFAGITAAKNCQRNDDKPLVLEVQDRPGGRTWTCNFRVSQSNLKVRGFITFSPLFGLKPHALV